jgi:hypothetical protein
MAMNESERDIVYEIKEKIGVITPYPTGWNKELNLVSWNGSAAKFDIRDWDPEHEHMSRGITLHPDEARKLRDMLKARDL